MAEGGDEDKTEDPTGKRLNEAYKNGNVPKSADLVSFMMLAAATMMVNMSAPYMSTLVLEYSRGMLSGLWQIRVDQNTAMNVYWDAAILTMKVLAIPFALFCFVGIVANSMQHKFIFSAQSLVPKFSKISPLQGFKRTFGKQAFLNLFKGLMKLTAVGLAVFFTIWPQRTRVESLINAPPEGLLQLAKMLVVDTASAALIVIGFVAAVDYFFARRRWWEGLKMSKQEVKDEAKQQDINPQVKAKIRRRRYILHRRRIATAVPKATVIIVNPTHYSVALQYEPGMQAPICLAKGVDELALKIREIAMEHEIPLVENPPLARALYATVDFDEEIPEEHYKAVAEVVGYVFRLRQRVKAWRAE